MNRQKNRLPLFLGIAGLLFVFCCFLFMVTGLVVVGVVNNTSPLEYSAPATARPELFLPTPVPSPTPVSPALVAPGVDIETEIYRSVYDRNNPSVVSVRIITQDILDQIPETDIQPFYYSSGEGSGFVIDTEGHIVTNRHVVSDASSVVVQFYDGILAPAEIVGMDRDTDLAVIKVDPQGLDLRPVVFGDIDTLHVGDRIIAIGNPFGNTNTLTTGIVSALGRQMELPDTDFLLPEVIQTDAAINPGNSGGPMLNAQGEVVGVTFMLQSSTRSNAGIGFGIPVYFVEHVSKALIEQGSYQHAYLGIRGNGLSPFEIRALGLDVKYGILIAEVIPGTPAAKAGLRGGDREVDVEGATFVMGGDIIQAINGQPIKTFDDLLAYLARYTRPGSEVTLSIFRDGKSVDVNVTLAARPQ
ncbi:MAG: PDZ domain-containing protein [Chloroflexi bacterium]|nr:PDZ domain-containing protein [Chloroflexota bacterium]